MAYLTNAAGYCPPLPATAACTGHSDASEQPQQARRWRPVPGALSTRQESHNGTVSRVHPWPHVGGCVSLGKKALAGNTWGKDQPGTGHPPAVARKMAVPRHGGPSQKAAPGLPLWGKGRSLSASFLSRVHYECPIFFQV